MESCTFISRVLNVVFDEAHCISQWGDTFWNEYAHVSKLRWFLPDMLFYVTSATLPTAIFEDVQEKLHTVTHKTIAMF